MTHARARLGDTVRIHYTGRLEDGRVFDSSTGSDPLELVVGENLFLHGFERSIVGMMPGDTRSITLSPERAYGYYQEDRVVTVARDCFPETSPPEIGARFQLPRPDGSEIGVEVLEVSDEGVTLDTNHPLAGETLRFDIELIEVISSGNWGG